MSHDLHLTGGVGGGVGRAQGKPLLRKDIASPSCGIQLRWKNGVEVVEAGGSGRGREGALSHIRGRISAQRRKVTAGCWVGT